MPACHNYESLPCLIFGMFLLEDEQIFMALTTHKIYYIVRQAVKSDHPLTPFQIIKLVFMAHGRYLAHAGLPLIRDRIDAWQHGPPIPVLYHELVACGEMTVGSLLYCGTPASSNARDEFFQAALSDIEREIMDGVAEEYGDWTGPELSRLCCEKGSPWDECYTVEYGTEMQDGVIRRYCRSEIIKPQLIQ